MMKNFITRFNSYPTIMVGILCLLFLQYDLSAQDLLERAKNNENIQMEADLLDYSHYQNQFP